MMSPPQNGGDFQKTILRHAENEENAAELPPVKNNSKKWANKRRKTVNNKSGGTDGTNRINRRND